MHYTKYFMYIISFSLQHSLVYIITTNPTLQIRKLKLTEDKQFIQGYVDSKQRSQNSNLKLTVRPEVSTNN